MPESSSAIISGLSSDFLAVSGVSGTLNFDSSLSGVSTLCSVVGSEVSTLFWSHSSVSADDSRSLLVGISMSSVSVIAGSTVFFHWCSFCLWYFVDLGFGNLGLLGLRSGLGLRDTGCRLLAWF